MTRARLVLSLFVAVLLLGSPIWLGLLVRAHPSIGAPYPSAYLPLESPSCPPA